MTRLPRLERGPEPSSTMEEAPGPASGADGSNRRWRWVFRGAALTVATLATAIAFVSHWMVRERERALRESLATVRADRAAGRRATALKQASDLASNHPGRGDVLYELGLCEADSGHLKRALEAWSHVPRTAPEFSPAAARRATVEIGRGRFRVAEDLLADALDGGHQPEARDALVRLLRSEGRFDEARRRYVEGIVEAPDLAAALRGLSRLDADPFAIEGIRIYLERAARQAPDDDRVWLGRAHLATQTGRFDDAERDLKACLQARPDDPAVWRAYLDWGRAADRPDAVLEAAKHLPADEALMLDLQAWLAARRGDRESERAALLAILAREPGRESALERLAELAHDASHSAEALRFRARKTALDRARDSYQTILADSGFAAHADELAELAAELGLKVEAAGWAMVAKRPGSRLPPPEPQLPARPTIADRLTELHTPLPTRDHATIASVVVPNFRDDAETAGLRFLHENGAVAGRLIPPVTSCGGVGLLDYDGDGWLDVYCVQGGPYRFGPGTERPGDRLYHNRGDGTFDDATESSGIAAMSPGYGHGVAVGDYDNDGHADLFITRWRRYALYRNRGDGTFDDVSDRAGLGGDRDWPTSAAFADLDNDGDLDLYVCHYMKWNEADPIVCADPNNPAIYKCSPRHFLAQPDHVFRNDGGRFVDVTREAGIVDAEGRGLGVLAAHLDDDDQIDLFVANDMTANYLWRSKGGFRFEESALVAGVSANASGAYQAGMGVACGDVDGDGLPDLAVTNFYNESTSLFRNLGGGLFADHTAATGLSVPSRYLLGFGIAFGDVNNDGRLDLMTVNGHVFDGRPIYPWTMPAQLLLGGDEGRLTDVSRRAGAPFSVNRIGRGLALGDLDNDGRLDAVVLAQNEPLAYFHNDPARVAGHALTIALEGRKSNRDAVGARVTITAGGRRQVAQRIGGGSFQSAGDPRLHFGLGASTQVEQVEVRWPSGRVDRYRDLQADTAYHVIEGDAQPHPLVGRKTPR